MGIDKWRIYVYTVHRCIRKEFISMSVLKRQFSPEILKKVSDITKRYRAQHGLSVLKFADAIGITRQAVYAWELEKNPPSLELLIHTHNKYEDWRREWAMEILNALLESLK